MITKEVNNIQKLGEILKSYPKSQLTEKDRDIMQQYKRYIDLLPLIVKSVDFTQTEQANKIYKTISHFKADDLFSI